MCQASYPTAILDISGALIRAEAEKRAGTALSAAEVSAYWRGEALRYIGDNAGQTANNVLRKAGEFVGTKEVANNRSLDQDRLFSPVLRFLPNPFPWLAILGIPGLLLITHRNRAQSLPIWAALGTVLVTFVVFIATARFRFHAMPLFAVCSGVSLAALVGVRRWRTPAVPALATLAVLAGVVSVWMGTAIPDNRIDRAALSWGYIRMGNAASARGHGRGGRAGQPGRGRRSLGAGFSRSGGGWPRRSGSALSRRGEASPRATTAATTTWRSA